MLLLLSGTFTFVNAQTVLNATGSGDTYQLINKAFGGTAYEVPDCSHPEFGPHITQVWDDTLNEYVFQFYIHVTPDNDRCVAFDRQRTEIKTYDPSPKQLLGYPGDVVEYKWMFKLPTGFQPSTSFTHIHQIKPVGGDEGNPIFTLSPRKSNPNNVLELIYIDNDNVTTKPVNAKLSDFINEWVTVVERISVSADANGTYSITITRNSDDKVLLTYTDNNILTIRTTNTFIRPKWGIYRSLANPGDLRDEAVRFAGFSINKIDPNSGIQNPVQNQDKVSVSPNPVSSVATLSYVLSAATQVDASLFDANGRLVQNILNNRKQSAGEYNQPVSAANLASGVYFLKFVTKSGVTTLKMTVEK